MKMKVLSFLRVFLAIITASFIGLSFHIFFLNFINPIIALKMQGIEISQAPYSSFINIFAYITILIPVSSIALIYYVVGDKIPFNNKLLKGVMLGIGILLIKGALIRQPLMDLLIGNSIIVVFLQHSQIWISNFSMAIVIAFIMPLQNKKKILK